MRRYVTRASDWDEHREQLVGHTIYEAEYEPRWSGLYDAHGNKLYATEDRRPIGFRMPQAPAKHQSGVEMTKKKGRGR